MSGILQRLFLVWSIGSSLLWASTAAGEQAAPVRIAGTLYLGDVPTAVADEFGSFERRGLRAHVAYAASGQESLARLRAGEVDFALMALTPLVLDRLRDREPDAAGDPVILASLVHSGDLTGVFARTDAGISDPSDLAGKRVAVQCGTNTEFALWLLERFHGLDPDASRRVCIPFGETLRALREGRVDAAVLPDPWAFQALLGLERASSPGLRQFDMGHIYTATWVIVTTRGMVDADPGLCRLVLGAYLDAIEIMERRPDAALEAYNRLEALPNRVTRERWESRDYDLGLNWTLLSALRQQLRWARFSGPIETKQFPQTLEFIAPGPLRELRPDLIDIPLLDPAEGTP